MSQAAEIIWQCAYCIATIVLPRPCVNSSSPLCLLWLECSPTERSVAISSFARAVDHLISGHAEAAASVDPHLACPQRVTAAREELHVAIRSLTTISISTPVQQGAEGRQSAGSNNNSTTDNDDSNVSKDGGRAPDACRSNANANALYSFASGVSADRNPHWV
ncbi:hypothetical protein CRUP_018859 [Coryphaenoides rupestris]|nr:hypothetical protein CRUP_018859 [Coryphaenoides rupestris]